MKVELHSFRLENAVIKREEIIPGTSQGYEIKSFIYFDLNGEEVSLLTRKIEKYCLPTLIGFDNGKNLSYADIYLEAIAILKNRGFITVPGVWKLSEDKIATTNLIETGGSVYDQKIDAIIERDTLDMDREFIKISFEKVAYQWPSF